MVCSSRSYSKTNRSFSSITLLAFHGMRSVVSRAANSRSVRYAPGLICQASARSVPGGGTPLPPSNFRKAFKNIDLRVTSLRNNDLAKLLETPCH